MKNILTTIVCALITLSGLAQTITIPNFDDKYADYVRKLESGETDIDYQDFRFSLIESEQFKILNKESDVFDSLKKEMYEKMNESNYQDIIKITTQMLSIDYTSMIAHKILRQTYKIIGDTVNAEKYKTIQFGLLYSIIKKGNGQSCATAWPIVQIEEEYFILQMVGAKLQKQSTDNTDGLCDKMEVLVDGKKKTYYFETSKVFEGYRKLGITK
jgi:hypothetical protein